MTLPRNTGGGNVVCEQAEWDILDASRPGYHTLLHSGVPTEQQAEKLARGTAGDPVPRKDQRATASSTLTFPGF
jgi:hypothetical protein